MQDPISLELEPMLAAPKPALPQGDGWVYEPKWDGFRSLVHRLGDRVDLASRGQRPLTRYFPELRAPLLALPADGVVLDGEIVVVTEAGLDFDALGQRIHPAASRIALLAGQTPAEFVAFDVLAIGGEDLRSQPLSERRTRLERLLAGVPPPIRLTPSTTDAAAAERWFVELEGAGLDGVIGKRLGEAYLPGKRAWVKRKHDRTADCVVIGFRRSADGSTLGSLLLGLYDGAGTLQYVGHTSGFAVAARRQVLAQLEPLQLAESTTMGRRPGALSRWSGGKDP
ncbi:MAG: ATP-dependent DNA ligase, partial [Candidatus Dormiibacterota bacterium]